MSNIAKRVLWYLSRNIIRIVIPLLIKTSIFFKSPWIITEDFLNIHAANYLVHGSDNKNPIPEEKLILFPRTEGVSSEFIRGKVVLTKIGEK